MEKPVSKLGGQIKFIWDTRSLFWAFLSISQDIFIEHTNHKLMCYFFEYFSHGLPIFKLGKLSILSVSLFVALTNWLYNGFTFLSFDSGPNFRVFTGAADVEGAAYVLIDIKGAGAAGAGGGHPLCLAAAAGKGTLLGGGQPLCLAAAAETEKKSWNNHTKWEKIRYTYKK